MKRPTTIKPTVADPYAVLGLPPTASLDEIKQAYFAQVRAHPPEHDPEAFKHIRTAYEQLRDPKQRQQTDLLRWQAWPESDLAGSFNARSDIELVLDPADVIHAARAVSDLGRSDFREDYREVRL
jgi:curved DNA-binding protein CbpA